MNCIFYGTLRDYDIQKSVLGEKLSSTQSSTHQLSDYQLFFVKDRLYPAIAARPGESCEIEIYYNLTENQLQKLIDYEEDEYLLEEWTIFDIKSYVFVPSWKAKLSQKIWKFEFFKENLKFEYLKLI